jgi:hypothetical protein
MEKRRRTQAIRQVRDQDLLASTTARLGFEQIGKGAMCQLAALICNPLFVVIRRLVLATIKW